MLPSNKIMLTVGKIYKLLRISKAAKFGVYQMISSVYERMDQPNTRHMQTDLSQYTPVNDSFPPTTMFMHEVGHQIQDMLLQ